MPFEILHGALVLLRRGSGIEGAEIATAAGLRILLARIKPVFSGRQFADHGESLDIVLSLQQSSPRVFVPNTEVFGRNFKRRRLLSSPPGLTRWSMLSCGLREQPKVYPSLAAAWIAGS
jgi:hypothetical protein